jgi:phage head maturation protease
MLHKAFGLDVKAVSDEGVIEGYASVFRRRARLSYGDIVAPGAFVDSLAKHKREGTMPLMLWGHDSILSRPSVTGTTWLRTAKVSGFRNRLILKIRWAFASTGL